MAEELYPDHLLPVIREREPPVDEKLAARYERFREVRESILLDYSKNTARAYYGDLEDIAMWAYERGRDPLDLSDKDIRQYIALLRRRGYSESTIRRRVTALRKLYDIHQLGPDHSANPARRVVIRRSTR